MLTSILVLVCSLLPVWAVNVHGAIRWNDICPSLNRLGQSKVILDNGKHTGTVSQSGSFIIPDVPPGTYVLSVLAHDFVFDQLRIDIFNSTAAAEARPYIAGSPLNPPNEVLLPIPLALTPRQEHEYFVPPGSFNLLSMFSNPMMIFMVIAAGMVLATPYLLKNIDPEPLREPKHDRAQRALTDGMSQSVQPKNEGSSRGSTGTSQGKVGSAKKAKRK
ncbi:hypothetical protein AX15_001130 [Amanita polypyramis BW_CC]|nr:hypothetical protein AX15_001130 [Amanita polypyramis BW_CC]